MQSTIRLGRVISTHHVTTRRNPRNRRRIHIPHPLYAGRRGWRRLLTPAHVATFKSLISQQLVPTICAETNIPLSDWDVISDRVLLQRLAEAQECGCTLSEQAVKQTFTHALRQEPARRIVEKLRDYDAWAVYDHMQRGTSAHPASQPQQPQQAPHTPSPKHALSNFMKDASAANNHGQGQPPPHPPAAPRPRCTRHKLALLLRPHQMPRTTLYGAILPNLWLSRPHSGHVQQASKARTWS